MLRAVVDTNVWVSAVLNPNGAPARIKTALQIQAFTLVVSTPMLDKPHHLYCELLSRANGLLQ